MLKVCLTFAGCNYYISTTSYIIHVIKLLPATSLLILISYQMTYNHLAKLITNDKAIFHMYQRPKLIQILLFSIL